MTTSYGIRTFTIALGVAILAYGATYLQKPRYAATESLYFPLNQDSNGFLGSRTSSADGGVSNFNGALTSPLVGARTQTAVGLVDSNGCAKFLVSSLHLAEHYGSTESKAISTVHQRLRTDIDKSGFLKIDFEDENAQVAVEVLDQVQLYLNRMSEKLSFNLSKKNREFVQDRLRIARLEESRAQQIAIGETGRSPSANPELLQKNLLLVETSYDEAKNKVASARAEIASSERSLQGILTKAKSFPGKLIVLNSIYEHLNLLTEDLQKRRLALVDAASVYRPKDPELHAVTQNEENTDKLVAALVDEQKNDLTEGIAPSLATAKANLASLEATTTAYGMLLRRLTSEYVRSVKDAANIESSRRGLTSAEARVTQLEAELELSLIAESRNPERFQVVDSPEPVDGTTYPKRSQTAFIMFVIAIAIQLVVFSPKKP